MPLFPRPSSLRRRTRQPCHNPLLRPVYIYPGVLRMNAERALAADAAAPAALYIGKKDSCAVCLEAFRAGRDIVRRLPCGHVFHSKCILSWVSMADRCPLCNTPILSPNEQHQAAMEEVEVQQKEPPCEPSDGPPVPNVTPATLCRLRLDGCGPAGSDSVMIHTGRPRERGRVYSFVLHDQARFAHLLDEK